MNRMFTTQAAANVLNVFQPFLSSLLKKDAIPYQLVKRHR